MRIFKRSALVILPMSLLLACAEQDPVEPTPDLAELRAGFENPPNAARPRVWWHWMNGNVTKEGITKDLERMERIGSGGSHKIYRNTGKAILSFAQMKTQTTARM